MLEALTALAGYAVGTAQILALDWWRERRAHRQALRLLRSEFRRLQAFDAKYNWEANREPTTDNIPKSPSVSSTFLETVTGTDWSLTDVHRDDDSQLSAITVADLCHTQQHYHNEIDRLLKEIQNSSDEDRFERMILFSKQYDKEVNQFQYVIADALRDIDRRLDEARFLRQLRRAGRRLGPGTNPPPVTPDDPRVSEFVHRGNRLPQDDA